MTLAIKVSTVKRVLSSLAYIFFITLIFSLRNDSLYFLFHMSSSPHFVSSHKQGFPLIDSSRNIFIYSFETKKATPVPFKSLDAGMFNGEGSYVVVSPDFRYTAVIDDDQRDLWIISNETLDKTRVTRNGELAGRINGWSPDSKTILYTTEHNESIGIGGNSNGKIVMTKPILPVDNSTILYTLTNGSKKKFSFPGDFRRFYDSNRVIIQPRDSFYGNPSERQSTFSLVTSKVESETLFTIHGAEMSQYDISKDLRTWTFVSHYPPFSGGDATIKIGDFPQKEGIKIQSGVWSEIQYPQFSPSANKIAYVKRLNLLDSLKNEIIVYDVHTHSLMTVGIGTAYRWISDTILMLFLAEVNTYTLYDLDKNKATKIF